MKRPKYRFSIFEKWRQIFFVMIESSSKFFQNIHRHHNPLFGFIYVTVKKRTRIQKPFTL